MTPISFTDTQTPTRSKSMAHQFTSNNLSLPNSGLPPACLHQDLQIKLTWPHHLLFVLRFYWYSWRRIGGIHCWPTKQQIRTIQNTTLPTVHVLSGSFAGSWTEAT